ncbi:MAG TPA: TolC family protein [Bacteroidetes bacterium]|nr:TolC family protein [Bacteroidota bacterium]
MKKRIFLLPVVVLGTIFYSLSTFSQQPTVKRLTLQDVIELAKEQSPQAIQAKHRFRASYWQYRTFKAEYLPSLTLEGTFPNYNRVYEKEFDSNTGRDIYVEKNTNNSTLELSLSQNIGLTGGSIFMNTDITRLDIFGPDGSAEYVTTPISIGYRQPISGFNSLKWQKIISPMEYEEAKKTYLSQLENVASRAADLFFDLALAEQNMGIAQINYENSDTLFRIAQGRYNIGTIAENELLQMELSFLNAGTRLNQAGIDLQLAEFQLRSFLGFNENVRIELILPNSVPALEVDVDQAIALARENNPELISLERQLREAERDVAQARAQKGFNADLFATFGLTQRADDLPGAYTDPSQQQRVQIGFSVPIMDWGLGRGRYKMAQSSQELVRTTVQQSFNDFEQNIFLNVMNFNLQDDQVQIAAKADTIAQKRYDVSKQRYLIGKIDVLDMNVAMEEKDVAKRGYISALRNFWDSFFAIRRLCLYDFIEDQPLQADFEALVE